MTGRRSAALCLALLVACGGDDDDGEDSSADIDAGLSSCLSPKLECPASAPTIGQAGGYKVDRFPVSWTYCGAADDVSVGQPVYFNVPADILSYSVTVAADFSQTLILDMKLDDQVVMDVDTIGVAPFRHFPNQAATIVLPVSPDTAPQGPYCSAILPITSGNTEGDFGELTVSSRRDGGGQGQFDLNVIVTEGTEIPMADLDAAIDLVGEIYLDGDAAALATVDYYTIEGFNQVNSGGQDIMDLRSSIVGTDERRFNIFVVEDFLDASLYGLAGGVPGPIGVHKTATSGVVVGVFAHRLQDGSIDVEELAATIGHELGHQIGLFHTSEADGSTHDNFSDTPECTTARDVNGDNFVSPEECAGLSDQNIMFWTAGLLPQQQMTPQQASILFFSPGMR